MLDLNGKVIAHILQENKITFKEAAHKIGISYNNLSSIVNGYNASSDKTKQKIIDFFKTSFNIPTDILFSKDDSDILIRLKLSKQPSKNEIALIREDFVTIEKTVELLNFTDKTFSCYADYINETVFDIYTEPLRGKDLYDWTSRCSDILEIIKNQNLTSYTKRLVFFHSEEIKELLFRGYDIDEIDASRAIIEAIEQLGIKIIFLPLRSYKILSASIPFFDKMNQRQEAIIILNKNSCISPETVIWNATKEFYNILFMKSDYIAISELQIELEDSNCEGLKFSRDILFNFNNVSNYIKMHERKLTYYFPSNSKGKHITLDKICENGWVILFCDIKKRFRVSYKLIINYLYKMNFCNIKSLASEEEFTKYLFASFNNYNNSFVEPAFSFIENEPQVEIFYGLRDHLEVCLNCFKIHSEDSSQIKEEYNKYSLLINEVFTKTDVESTPRV